MEGQLATWKEAIGTLEERELARKTWLKEARKEFHGGIKATRM